MRNGQAAAARPARRAGHHERIVRPLREDFADWLIPVPSTAGLHLCAQLTPAAPVDLDKVRDRARRSGVAIETLKDYCTPEHPLPGLLLGYGSIPTEHIPEGLQLLHHAFQAELTAQ